MDENELRDYIDGRTLAIMTVCALLVSAKGINATQLTDIFNGTCKVMPEADLSPRSAAFAEGYVSLSPYLTETFKMVDSIAKVHLTGNSI